MTKKIAILTQPLMHNYGGILQNFALQKVLISLGFIPETINYRKKSVRNPVYLDLKIFLYNKLKNRLPLTSFNIKRIFEKNIEFINQNISLSKEITSKSKLVEYFETSDFDYVIVGSDQVWRPKYSPDLEAFYLDFLDDRKIQKIAYAASFGTETWEYSKDLTLVCNELINKFNHISVREIAGVLLCEKNFKLSPKLVLDPVLLLSKEEYLNLFNHEKIDKKGDLLLTYLLDDGFSEIYQKVAEELSLSIYSIKSGISNKNLELNSMSKLKVDGVKEWLKYFVNSEFIVTDSFHGTLLSIIFNKQFLTIGNKERGLSRFSSILNLLGLQDRLITSSSDFDLTLIQNKINYSIVNKKLNEEKTKSLLFLKNSLMCS